MHSTSVPQQCVVDVSQNIAFDVHYSEQNFIIICNAISIEISSKIAHNI